MRSKRDAVMSVPIDSPSLTMEGRRPVVVAKINDNDVRFVLDSGAYFSGLTETAAVEYKLPRSAPSGVAEMGIAGGRISTLATVRTFTLGTYPIHDMKWA